MPLLMPLYTAHNYLCSIQQKQKSMQPKDFQEEFELAAERLSRPKKRRSDIVIPSPLSMVGTIIMH